MAFSALDWAILAAYLCLALAAGIWASRKASTGIESYFAADRSLPWWWLGTSMVATTFAADTPLVVAGITANHGVAGNWLWWSWVVGYAAMAVLFAAGWRKSGVLTDAELCELRYEGKPAAFLRAFKAGFLAIVLNCIILGWVFRAMSKIADPFIRWESILGYELHRALAGVWPSWLVMGTPENTWTVLIVFALTVLYSSLGGIRGVILTDLLQFTLAVIGSVTFAAYAVAHVGGLGGLVHEIRMRYPDPDAILGFAPTWDSAWLPFQVFLIYLFVQWWAKPESDGTGYLAQRCMTAADPGEASKGALWFTAANFAIRTWPWVLVGLVGLAVFPKGNEAMFFDAGRQVAADREMAYPVLMQLLLPHGVLGLLFTSLLAAFMSTVDTHLNWGTSYLVNDIYKRFLDPRASERKLVTVSRACVVALAAVAVLVASQIGSIEKAWKFFLALGAGMGLPMMLRWVWWRVNAWTEIAGMISAILAAIVLSLAFPEWRGDYVLFWTAAFSVACAFAATYLTPPVSDRTLRTFHDRVKPVGWWGPVARGGEVAGLARQAGAWGVASLAVYALMFGLGTMLLKSLWAGLFLFALGCAGIWATLRLLGAAAAR